MEPGSSFDWFYYNEEELTQGGISELKQLLLQTRLELDASILSAQDEISTKEKELIHLKDLLMVTMKERDEANSKCQELMLENSSLQQQLQQQQEKEMSFSRVMSIEDKYRGGTGDANTSFSCSDTEESIVSSSPSNNNNNNNNNNNTEAIHSQITLDLANKRPLPEKGKLLKAVMEAGPLLQTLLLAGQLPKWQHPPPRLHSIEIPPVTIPSPTDLSKKRPLDLSGGSASSSSCKYET
ncbi:hypothetical protein Dimus_011533 [Dionaea muscipula]